MPVASITRVEIQAWVDSLRDKDAVQKARPKQKKLSDQTIARVFSLCSQIFVEAVNAKIIGDNPCSNVKLNASKAELAWTYLTVEEQRAIADCEANPEFERLAVLFAIGTGLMAGEQFNLRISDVKLDADPPHVRVSFGASNLPIPPRNVDLLGPSLDAAKRAIEMLPTLVPENPHNLLFPTPRGNRRPDGKAAGRVGTIRNFLHRAGIYRPVRWMDLRHTCGVAMASGLWGTHYGLTDIQQMFGYSNVAQAERYAPFIRSQLGSGQRRADAMRVTAAQIELPVLVNRPQGEDRPITRNPSYSLGELAVDTHKTEDDVEVWVRAALRKKQIVFTGPPGTGKTFCAQLLARHLIAGGNGICDVIQFHPTYGYEDFIQGIRAESDGSQLRYPMVPGQFLVFCREAAGRGQSVLIIDEMNRANLARVFGELLYLLEYRDRELRLASGNTLKVPNNLIIIGTMNTADRSIAMIDHALRRRFAFVTLSSDLATLARFHARRETGFDVKPLAALLESVNRTIDDPRYHVGVSFFMRDDLKAGATLQDVWKTEVEPYLTEYFFDQPGVASSFHWDTVAPLLER